ncbi:MAG: WYL domain-containing protein [Actinobacteria bacterium HGW-Actinobacteria-4]|nr:MAG: WYL domain-containing protein [Actinobacteria bacterium HGW-Actinobacteria-4]
MAEKALPRLTRLLGIVTYLEQQGPTSFAVLAERFGVSEDQIRKDVGTLSVSGLPGYMPDDLLDFDFSAFDHGVASLTESHGVSQVRLSAREAVALTGALSALVAAGTAPAAALTALDKLRGAMDGNDPMVVLPASSTKPEVSQALLDAVARRRVATVTYVDAHDRLTEREIEPHRLVTIDGIGYVECFCRRAGDYRTLRLDRMNAVTVTDEPVVAAPSDADGFTLVPRFDARVVVARSGRWALEELPGVALDEVGDDVEATFGVTNAHWVAGRLLAIAPYLRVVEPEELVQALGDAAKAVETAQAG